LAKLSAWVGTISRDTREEAANLRHLRAAVNIIGLRRVERSLAPAIVRLIEAFLARLATAGHAGDAGDDGPLPYSLVKTLDATLAATLSEPTANCRNNALMNLVGIRRALFSAAPAYLPPLSNQGRLTA